MFSSKFNSNSKVLIIGKDAGSANIISSFVKKKKIKALYHLKKPALEIFKKKKIFSTKSSDLGLVYNCFICTTKV